MESNPTIRTCTFVESSNIFQGCPHFLDAWNYTNLPWTFGDANRTLVTKESFLRVAEDVGEDDRVPRDETERILRRIKQLPDNAYIDLES